MIPTEQHILIDTLKTNEGLSGSGPIWAIFTVLLYPTDWATKLSIIPTISVDQERLFGNLRQLVDVLGESRWPRSIDLRWVFTIKFPLNIDLLGSFE
jgi:hypothetical protein